MSLKEPIVLNDEPPGDSLSGSGSTSKTNTERKNTSTAARSLPRAKPNSSSLGSSNAFTATAQQRREENQEPIEALRKDYDGDDSRWDCLQNDSSPVITQKSFEEILSEESTPLEEKAKELAAEIVNVTSLQLQLRKQQLDLGELFWGRNDHSPKYLELQREIERLEAKTKEKDDKLREFQNLILCQKK